MNNEFYFKNAKNLTETLSEILTKTKYITSFSIDYECNDKVNIKFIIKDSTIEYIEVCLVSIDCEAMYLTSHVKSKPDKPILISRIEILKNIIYKELNKLINDYNQSINRMSRYNLLGLDIDKPEENTIKNISYRLDKIEKRLDDLKRMDCNE